MAGKTVNKVELSELLGVSERTLTDWQNDEALPFTPGVRGASNQYDTAAVFQWYGQREVRKAGKGESQRDREARLRGDLLEMELATQRGSIVPADQVKPVWENRVMVAAAYQASRHSRLAGILEAAPGLEAKREILKREDAEFLTRLGVYGDRMQADFEELLQKVSTDEAQSFLKRMAAYDQQSLEPPAGDGVEGDGPPEEDPPESMG